MKRQNKEHLPALPGVYLFKDRVGTILYIGKAKSIKLRVNSYFQKSIDWKVSALLQEYAVIDYVLTTTEHEALLLEADLIKKHQPKYNVLLRNGQPFVYLLFTDGELPVLKVVRNKEQQGKYFGPFLQKAHARGVARYLMRTFRLQLCNKTVQNGCLDYHINLCAGNCRQDFDISDYLFRLELAKKVLENNSRAFLREVKEKIKQYSAALCYEKAKHLAEYLENLDTIFSVIKTKFSESKEQRLIQQAIALRTYSPAIADDVGVKLQKFLRLPKPALVIDCFDISHFQSSFLVGACVRFTHGKPDKNKFRRFKIRSLDKQNDYAALQEIVSRRYKDKDDFPDLIVIDGGKGQLSAVQKIMNEVPCVSLAKREETVYSSELSKGKILDIKTDEGKVLIALRDYTHHFAISYHRMKRSTVFGGNKK